MAADEVIVHETGRLHERIDRRRADEAESAPLELFRERRRFRAHRRQLRERPKTLRSGRGSESPDEVGQPLVELERRDGISDRGLDLPAVADDPGVPEQPLHVALVERGDAFDREPGERTPKVLALAKNRQPREAGLEALQREQFEQRVVPALLSTPLVVVVGAIERVVTGPAAAGGAAGVDRKVVHRTILPIGSVHAMFQLTLGSAPGYLVERGLAPAGAAIEVAELTGGVSAAVIAARIPSTGASMVVKQALERLRVDDDWRAKQERTELEVAALRLCARLTPGRVPRLLDSDPAAHVVVMELLPGDAPNWQSEVAAGRAHAAAGAWAGETLGIWHFRTAGDPAVASTFDDFESFEQQRLHPFYETVCERLPDAAAHIAPRAEELRRRGCFVDGDYAMKNILVGPDRNWKLDFEVAHYGNPVFDLGFFLSFVVLSAVRWPALRDEMRVLAQGFLDGYRSAAGDRFAGDETDVAAHTGCLVLARTDGKSPAQFLEPASRERARAVGLALLREPELGLWQ